VKTGVQEIVKAWKILDSGFRRNDRKKTEPDFFTASGGYRGICFKSLRKNPPNPPFTKGEKLFTDKFLDILESFSPIGK
jgi:hypothetical protein